MKVHMYITSAPLTSHPHPLARALKFYIHWCYIICAYLRACSFMFAAMYAYSSSKRLNC